MATNAPITKELFGKTSNGEEVYKFTFSNDNKVTITVLNYGCIIYEIKTPDKKGEVVDVNLGFDNLKDYETNNNYFGALCGRVANRIGNAQFTLDNKTYTCSKNDPFGGHCVHGGHVGFARRVWSWSIKDNQLILSYTDPDGSEGMPGEVVTHVTYSLDSDNVFTMDYQATTNKATPIDLGSHFMVNLGGHNAGPIRDHIITINSNRFLEMGKDFLPTGELIHVGGTCMDFRHPRLLPGKVLELMTGDMAFHHGYCVGDRTERGQKKLMGRVEHNHSGRYMEVYSTNVLVFVYSNHYMETILKKMPCKDGAVYEQYGAIEMMPMGYPNAINMPRFPTSVVRPGETYHETAWYKFGVEK